MAEKAKLYDLSKCMGCRGCQVSCKQWNGLPAEKTKFFAAEGGYQNPKDLSPSTWCLVKFFESLNSKGVVWRFRTHACMHCTDAPCVDVCPTDPKAMTRDADTGIVYVDAEKCIGCGSCVEACPFGVPHVDKKAEKARKCTGCLSRIREEVEPACAKTCITGALSFGSLKQMKAKAKKAASALKKQGLKPYVYGVKEVGGTHSIYVLPEGLAAFDLPKSPKAKLDGDLLRRELQAYRDAGTPLTASIVARARRRCGKGTVKA